MAKLLINGVWCEDYLPDSRITQFARCGCTSTCACVVQGGECITVAGNGSPNTPYQINFTQGCAEIATLDTNTVDLEGNGTVADPLEARVKRVGDNLGPLNNTPGGGANLLKENTGPDGLYVSCEDIQDCVGAAVQAVAGDCLTYDDAANSISVQVAPEPNGLECSATGLLVTPSSDAGNSLTYGSDNRLYSAGATGSLDVLDTDCINMTRTGSGTQADPYIISAVPIIAPEPNGGLDCSPTGLLITPSTDPNNALVYGTDGSLFVPNAAAGCPTSADPTCLTFTPDGLGGCIADLIIDPDPCNPLVCGPNGLLVNDPQRRMSTTMTNPPPATGPDFPGQAFFNVGTTNPGDTGFTNLALQCQTLTNDTACPMQVHVDVGTSYSNMRWNPTANGAQEEHVRHFTFATVEVDGVPQGVQRRIFEHSRDWFPTDVGTNRNDYSVGGSYTEMILLAPGSNVEVCVFATVDIRNGNDGQEMFVIGNTPAITLTGVTV